MRRERPAGPEDREPTLRVSVTGVTALLLAMALALTTASTLVAILVGGDPCSLTDIFRQRTCDVRGALVRLFHSNVEANLPTAYQVGTLATSAALCWLIGLSRRSEGRLRTGYWLGLGCLMVLLAVDEGFMLHERTIEPVREATGATGFLYYAWVIPWSILTALVLVACVPFLMALPTRTRVRLLVAGAVYVTGALGMEMIGAYLLTHGQGMSLANLVVGQAEEALEMLGIVILIGALLDELRTTGGGVHLRLDR